MALPTRLLPAKPLGSTVPRYSIKATGNESAKVSSEVVIVTKPHRTGVISIVEKEVHTDCVSNVD